MVCLEQCFSTFLNSRHPSFVIEQFGGTPSNILLVNSGEVQKLAAPLELFTAPKGSAAPRLRITALCTLPSLLFGSSGPFPTKLKKLENYRKMIFLYEATEALDYQRKIKKIYILVL